MMGMVVRGKDVWQKQEIADDKPRYGSLELRTKGLMEFPALVSLCFRMIADQGIGRRTLAVVNSSGL